MLMKIARITALYILVVGCSAPPWPAEAQKPEIKQKAAPVQQIPPQSVVVQPSCPPAPKCECNCPVYRHPPMICQPHTTEDKKQYMMCQPIGESPSTPMQQEKK